MSSIRVNWQTASTAADAYGTYRQELSSAIGSVRSIRSYRCMSGGSFNSVYQALDRVVRQMEEEKDALRNLGDGLSEVLKNYQKYEGNVTAQIVGNALEEENIQTSAEIGDSTGGVLKASDIWKLVGSLGIVGNTFAAGGTLVTGARTGDLSVKSILTAGRYLSKAVGAVAKQVSKTPDTQWKKALVNFNNGLKGIETPKAAFQTTFKNWIDGLNWGKAKQVSGKISVAANWAGVALTGAINLAENLDEFEGQEGEFGRLVAETAIETVVDVALPVAAQAGVVALATAVGVTSAPAAVICAAAVGVVWAVNTLSKKITGKDIAENVSDFVCDAGEAVVGKAKKAISSRVQWAQACAV